MFQKAHVQHRVKELCGFVVSVHQGPGTAVDLAVHNGPTQIVLKARHHIIFWGSRLGPGNGAVEVASACNAHFPMTPPLTPRHVNHHLPTAWH